MIKTFDSSRRGFFLVTQFILLCLVLITSSVSADEQLFTDMIANENKNTLGLNVSTQEVPIEHIEIPLSQVQMLFGDGLPEYIPAALKDDEKQIYRWVLHPTDYKYRQKIINKLNSENIKYKTGYYLLGRMTISRSLIVREPFSDVYFSLKTSTDNAPGPWSDRPQQIRSAVSSLLMSDYLQHVLKTKKLKHSMFLTEPMLVTMPLVNLAQNVRIYDELNEGSAKYFSLSALFGKQAPKLAQEWLGPDAKFSDLRNAVMKLMGRALTEIVLTFGVVPSSAHLQNFKIRQDINDPKNVKVVWIDNADSHLFEPIVSARGGQELIKHTEYINFPTRQLIKDRLQILFSPMNGFIPNAEITPNHPIRRYYSSKDERVAWQRPFFEGIQEELQAQLGKTVELKSRSQGPHIVFEFDPKVLTSANCLEELTQSDLTTPKSYDIVFPPQD